MKINFEYLKLNAGGKVYLCQCDIDKCFRFLRLCIFYAYFWARFYLFFNFEKKKPVDEFSLSLFGIIAFINHEHGEEESEAMQSAVTQGNAESNVSLTLKTLNISTTISLFDQGKM